LRLSQVNITSQGAAYLYIDRGVPKDDYSPEGVSLNNNMRSLVAESDPDNPLHLYVRFVSSDANANVTVTWSALPLPWLEMTQDFLVMNVTLAPAPNGATGYTTVNTPLVFYKNTHIGVPLTGGISRSTASISAPKSASGDTSYDYLNTPVEFYDIFEYAFLAPGGNVSVALSKPQPPITLTSPGNHRLTLKPYQQILAIVELPGLSSNRVFNVTFTASANLAGYDQIQIGINKERWYTSAGTLALTSSQKSITYQLSNCQVDMNTRHSFWAISYQPELKIGSFGAWAMGSVQIDLDLNFTSSYLAPVQLYSDIVVQIPDGETRLYVTDRDPLKLGI
jgi:hypothetical protein